jgi:hypothetical protein
MLGRISGLNIGSDRIAKDVLLEGGGTGAVAAGETVGIVTSG